MTLDLSKGVKFAVSWLHKRAEEMNDPHAKAILNSAAFSLGQQNASGRVELEAAPSGQAPLEGVKEALGAAVRAANLALFVIRKQGVMPNSSWEGGFKDDMAKAEAMLAKLTADPLPASAEPVATKSCGCVFRDLDVACRNPECKICHDLPASGEVEAGTPGAPEAFAALDVADRIIERAFGTEVPGDWHEAYRAVAKARNRKSRRALPAAPTEGR